MVRGWSMLQQRRWWKPSQEFLQTSVKCEWHCYTTSLSYCTKIRVIVVLVLVCLAAVRAVTCNCTQIFCIFMFSMERIIQSLNHMTGVTWLWLHQAITRSEFLREELVCTLVINIVRDDILCNFIWQLCIQAIKLCVRTILIVKNWHTKYGPIINTSLSLIVCAKERQIKGLYTTTVI